MEINQSRKKKQKTTASVITAILVAVAIVGSTAVNAFLMTATPASAAPTKDRVVVRDQGIGGTAIWSDTSAEVAGLGTVVRAELFVTESEGLTDIFVQLITEEGNFAQAFTTIDQNVFDADNRLATGTLTPVTIEVVIFDEFLNPIGTAEITIEATWEGTGDLDRQRTKLHSVSDDFSLKFSQSVLVREATAEGSINDADLGTADFAQLVAFRNSETRVSETIVTE